jgi:hypothetical protein
MPVSTASCTQGVAGGDDLGAQRPTLTKVPVASLKSSAMRPSKRSRLRVRGVDPA